MPMINHTISSTHEHHNSQMTITCHFSTETATILFTLFCQLITRCSIMTSHELSHNRLHKNFKIHIMQLPHIKAYKSD